MGDVGSLALGGALGTVAILIKQELLLGIVGGVFVLEALSVIIQVASFKLTGKRVFRMAPLHHHFELIGWSEPKVITRFVIVGDHLRAVQPDDVEAAVTAMARRSRCAGQRVTVVGRGAERRRGGGAARRARGARDAVRRGAEPGRRPPGRLTARGVALELGGHSTATFTGADLVVLSPGVPPEQPAVAAARAARRAGASARSSSRRAGCRDGSSRSPARRASRRRRR